MLYISETLVNIHRAQVSKLKSHIRFNEDCLLICKYIQMHVLCNLAMCQGSKSYGCICGDGRVEDRGNDFFRSIRGESAFSNTTLFNHPES